MPVGSTWDMAIPAKLAYGENPPPGMEPNAVLLFEVQLLSIKKAAAGGASPAPQ
jgi:FKBP-type peptidyl-prolyl cis-trans isomerase FkpA